MLAHAGAVDESLAIAMIVAALWLGWIGRSRLKGTGFGRLPRQAAYLALAAAAGLLVVSTIVPRAIFPAGPDAPPDGVVRLASTAGLSFVRPADGALAAGDQLELVMELDGGTVIDGTGSVTPDTGHIHVSVDGALVSMTYGTVQVLDLRAYDPGTHTIVAEFVAADHRSFTPAVTASLSFERPAS